MLKYLLNISTSLFLFVLLSMLFIVSPVKAETTQITNNTVNDLSPQIDDGKVVWLEADSSTQTYGIFLYDIATGITTNITNDTYQKGSPQISNGKIVWYGYPNLGNGEIFLYDIATGTTTQLTNTSYSEQIPQIQDGKVIWEGIIDGNSQIFLYDIATGISSQISNTYNNGSERISNGKIVWQTQMGPQQPGYEVFLYDIATGTTTQLTNNGLTNDMPQTDGSKVVWREYDSIQSKVYLYDIATGTATQITNGDLSVRAPVVRDGKISFEGYDGVDNEIYLYDIATGTTTQVTNNTFTDSQPQMHDGKIAWFGQFYTFGQGLSVYDIASGTTTEVAQNAYFRSSSQWNDGKIVWAGRNDTGDYDIFIADLESRQITALSPAKIWVSKGILNFGVRFDLLAEAYKDNTLISSGQVDSVQVGSGNFNNATLVNIPFNTFSPADFPSGSALKIKVSVRNACSGSLLNSGNATLWFNNAAANSQFGATIDGDSSDYFLRNNFVLTTTQGTSPRQSITTTAGARCSAFKSFGTWSITL